MQNNVGTYQRFCYPSYFLSFCLWLFVFFHWFLVGSLDDLQEMICTQQQTLVSCMKLITDINYLKKKKSCQ